MMFSYAESGTYAFAKTLTPGTSFRQSRTFPNTDTLTGFSNCRALLVDPEQSYWSFSLPGDTPFTCI